MQKTREKSKLIIACDGESASGKSTAAKLISKKYNLLLINSGLLYRYCSKLIIESNPKDKIKFLKNKFRKISYQKIKRYSLHSEIISKHVAIIAKDAKIRNIVNKFQKELIQSNNRICVEGRDIASNILKKNPKYDLAFYFKCNLKKASYRRWKDQNKKIPLKEIKKSLKKRTIMDKKRTHSPLKKVKDAYLIRTDILNKKMMLKKMSDIIEKKFN